MCGGDAEPSTTSYKTPACLEPTPAAIAKNGDLVVEKFPVMYDGYTYLHSHIAYVKGRPPAPVVFVHHNFAGLKQFDIDQASFLARVGYVGLAVDLYKERETYKLADREHGQSHWEDASGLMNGLYLNPKAWRGLLNAHVEAAFQHPAVASGLAGAIGYCLGGQSGLEQIRDGQPLQAVVTFHGLLQSRPMYQNDPMEKFTQEEYLERVDVPQSRFTSGCRVVVENGEYDEFVGLESIGEFMQEMDTAGVDWQFHNHARTPHGFALAPGSAGSAYQEDADRRSTMVMLATFAEAWPDFRQNPVEMNACGTKLHTFVAKVGQSEKQGHHKRQKQL